MKKSVFIFLICLLSWTGKSQRALPVQYGLPFFVGYYGHYATHPGVITGGQLILRKHEKEKVRKKRTVIKYKSLFYSPQFAFYIHPKNQTDILMNNDIGYRKMNNRFGLYSAYSTGIGYVRQFNEGSTYTVKSNGTLSEKRFASRGYLLLTVNYEFGQQLNDRVGWYSKISVSSKTPYNTGFSMDAFLELGIKFNPFSQLL